MIYMNMKTMTLSVGAAALLLAGCSESDSNSADATLEEQLNYEIIGIEPGAGVSGLAANTLESYDNLAGWKIAESSTAGMLGSLDKAIKNEEPIVVVGWTPHWMFSAYDLKFLADPKGTLGQTENIQTLARQGLEAEQPQAYEILDNFEWDIEDLEKVMYDAQNMSFEEAATAWIDANQDKVKAWTAGVDTVDGEEIEIISTPWDSERASGAVIAEVLTQHGYDVTVTPVDPAIMFQAIATGEADATVAPWLPTTHQAFYDKHKDDIVDLGINLEGTQNGFVVPSYMDIDSIEDLQPKK